MDDILRVHHIEPISRANGPGHRCVLWLQGCSLGCPDCFNPETHATDSGQPMDIADVLEKVTTVEANVQGLTITGGEPLQQAGPLLKLLNAVRQKSGLSVLLFTGFSVDELTRQPHWVALSEHVDVLIAGRYERSQRVAAGLLGSANKTVTFLSDRYSQSDLDEVPSAEIVVGTDGEIVLSGIDPVKWGVQ